MKKILTLFVTFTFLMFAYSQNVVFNYSVGLKLIKINNLIGLHSFAIAQHNNKWLIIGGRKDGIHARQPNSAFPISESNSNIYVVDVNTNKVSESNINSLNSGLKEQLQSTNMNFYQDDDTLYLIGGYGYSNTHLDHTTFPNITSISISGLIDAIENSKSIASNFKQITDNRFALNGGQLGKINDTFYLVGGHKFEGRYNPMGHNTYTQTYNDGILKFTMNNSGNQLSVNSISKITDQVHLHRRDFNLVPQIFPNGEFGYTLSSGVFQVGVDLPFLYPVDILSSGYYPQTSFNQYLSNYHSARACLYDSIHNTMHSIFFGGLSQYSYKNNVLVEDKNVPFVKQISLVTRDATGKLFESLFQTEMPDFVGSSAEFVLNHDLPIIENEILNMSNFSNDSLKIGHIIGGIYSSQINPFTSNNTNVTKANNVVYEVWLFKNYNNNIQALNLNDNMLDIDIFPNPKVSSNSVINFRLQLPENGFLKLYITDITGKIIETKNYSNLYKGSQLFEETISNNLSNGLYFFNFSLNGKYSSIKKVIINK